MSIKDGFVLRKATATVGALVSLSLPFSGLSFTPGAFAQTVAPVRTVRVVKGDTLDAIAARLGVNVEELMRLNRIAKPEDLQIDQVLKLPPSKGLVQVGSGDTMDALATRYGTTVAALLKANPGVKPDQLKVGTWLRLPPPAPAKTKPPVKAMAPATAASPTTPAAPASPPAIRPAPAAVTPPTAPQKPTQAQPVRWRYYGSTVVDWAGWKLHPGGVRVTIVQPSPADVGPIRAQATAVAVHCASLRQAWFINGVWEAWVVPEGRSVSQQIVLDLCANVSDPAGTPIQPPAPPGP